ncbi:hypothetical protein AVEN_203704-1 [Araneus ventricosus]|uniref:Uncharacterized protein n=1 Tax=Araneus ventricosus TaxID=182803 RepID=A0A4Y2EZJ1_ARAVE|nr:hypothetical protein AVEN_203704-1 [Araneus ventricosus]
MSNTIPSPSTSAYPIPITSSSGTKNKKNSPTFAVPPASHNSSEFTTVKVKEKPKYLLKVNLQTITKSQPTLSLNFGNHPHTKLILLVQVMLTIKVIKIKHPLPKKTTRSLMRVPETPQTLTLT